MLFDVGSKSLGITGLAEYLHITADEPAGRSSHGMFGRGLPEIFISLLIFYCFIKFCITITYN